MVPPGAPVKPSAHGTPISSASASSCPLRLPPQRSTSAGSRRCLSCNEAMTGAPSHGQASSLTDPIFAWVIALFIMVMQAAWRSRNCRSPSTRRWHRPRSSSTASYPGASAQTLEDSRAVSVIEREMNGSPGLMYMESVSPGQRHRHHHASASSPAPTPTWRRSTCKTA